MIFAALLLAAIITERNDVYNGVGCLTPPQYRFVGSATHPGIESRWIPYGTFTDGIGGTEYLRATSNLMGVVASALGGLAEREWAEGWGVHKYMLRPLQIPSSLRTDDGGLHWSDDGAFLASSSNLTLRIADQLNLPMIDVVIDGTNYHYEEESSFEDQGILERRVLGAMLSFGSRRLEALAGNAEPPISSEWSSALPYNVADSNLWRNVYPTFDRCEQDIYFVTDDYFFNADWGMFPNPFLSTGEGAAWGTDVYEAYRHLVEAITPLDVQIEDVLSYDTGWQYEVTPRLTVAAPTAKYLDFGNGLVATKTEQYADTNDYAHFTNGTTRLDWTRLGIVCQMERQMDTTYRNVSDTVDTLPLMHLDTTCEDAFESTGVSLALPTPTYNGQTFDSIGTLDGVSWYSLYTDYQVSTNDYANTWSSPTCRVPAPNYARRVESIDGYVSDPIEIDHEFSQGIIEALCNQIPEDVTDGELSRVTIYGAFAISNDMSLVFRTHDVEGWVERSHYNSEVEVSSSDGLAGSISRVDSGLTGDPWEFYDGRNSCQIFFDYGGGVPGGTFIQYFASNVSVYYEDNLHFGMTNGLIAVTSLVVTASGEGNPTNWTWQISGVPEMPTNCVSKGFADNNIFEWQFGDYAGGTGDGGYIYYDTARDTMSLYFQLVSATKYCYFTAYDIPRARSWTSPSVTVAWNTYSYSVYEPFYYDAELWAGVIDVDPASQSIDVKAWATITKTTSPTFTLESSQLATQNFWWPDMLHDWGRISAYKRSEVEMLLYASGNYAFADNTGPSPDNDFAWDNLEPGKRSRFFRLANSPSAETFADANSGRYNLLASLSRECKAKCQELGCMPIDPIADIGKTSASERKALLDDLADATTIGARFDIAAYDCVFSAYVHRDDGGGYAVDTIISPSAFPATVASTNWELFYNHDANYAGTNFYDSVRADAFQAPMEKTVWKFKNLRDPDL